MSLHVRLPVRPPVYPSVHVSVRSSVQRRMSDTPYMENLFSNSRKYLFRNSFYGHDDLMQCRYISTRPSVRPAVHLSVRPAEHASHTWRICSISRKYFCTNSIYGHDGLTQCRYISVHPSHHLMHYKNGALVLVITKILACNMYHDPGF